MIGRLEKRIANAEARLESLDFAIKERQKRMENLTSDWGIVVRGLVVAAFEEIFSPENNYTPGTSMTMPWTYERRVELRGLVDASVRRMARLDAAGVAESEMERIINNESFIDDIVARIRKKQL